MGPLTRSFYRQCDPRDKESLLSAAHVLLSRDMWERVYQITESAGFGTEFQGRLPAPAVVVEIEDFGSYAFFDAGEEVQVSMLANKREALKPKWALMGWAKKKSINIKPAVTFVDRAELGGLSEKTAVDIIRSISAVADVLFCLMAEPRFVKQNPFTKSRRKTEIRQYGGALPHTWVKLGWTIGASTTPKGDRAGSAPIRAFHMVRAHWRNYGDQKTPKGERRPGRSGWWVWIEAYYSGNPALGEIKHHYMPKIEDPGRSSPVIHANVAARIASVTA